MSRRWRVGLGLLVVLGAATLLTYRLACPWPRADRTDAKAAAAPVSGAVPALPLGGGAALTQDGLPVRGVVRLPDGTPAVGASVELHRARTVWPEWDGEVLDGALTGPDGAFQFRVPSLAGLFVVCEHSQFAEAAVEVPLRDEALDVRLDPGFELAGVVTNDVGAPVPNARVAVESVPGEQRRVVVTTTSANGRYTFKNLRAGPVRLLARHESWQPVVEPAVVVGAQARVDLRCERPAMTPLRGRVLSATTEKPVAGALVQLLPVNQTIGLCDPISARTGPDGAFLLTGLPRANLKLLVRHPDHASPPPTTQRVGDVAEVLDLELAPRSTVVGKLVVDEPPALWQGGEVLELQDCVGCVDYATVAADGSFAFAASMSPGRGLLRVVGRQFAFQGTRTTEISVVVEEQSRTELEVVVARPTSVRGKLVDVDGRPLPGAQVVQAKVFADLSKDIRDAAENLDPSRFGRQVAQLFGSEREEVLAITDAAGDFELRGLMPGSHSVRFVAPGHARLQLRARVPANDRRVEVGALVLPPARRLQGRVRRGDRGIAGASVTVLGQQAQAVVTTDHLGRFVVEDLPAGRYSVKSVLPGIVEETGVDVPAVGATPNLDIVLRNGRTVRGVVVGSSGQPLAGAVVSVRGGLSGAVTTAGDGQFALDLPPFAAGQRGTELLVAWGDRQRPQAFPLVSPEQPQRVVMATSPTGTLTARVAGLPGQIQLPGGLLRLARDGENEPVRTHWVEFTDGELRWPFAPTGRVRIEIACDGFAPYATVRDVVAGREEALGQIWLEPGATVQGLVVDSAGNPVANAVALLGEEGDLDLFEAKTRSGVDGRFTLGGVSARSANLVVRAAGFAPTVVELQLPSDVLSAQPVRVPLDLGATIQVRVRAGRGGTVQLRRDGRLLAVSDLDRNGSAWFAGRAAGSYTVQLDGAGDGKSFVVPPGSLKVMVDL